MEITKVSFTVAALILGVALLGLGIAGNFSVAGATIQPAEIWARFALCVIGVLIVVFSFTIEYRRSRSAQKIDLDRDAANAPGIDRLGIEECGVTIRQPRSGDKVPSRFKVEGTWGELPPDYEIWIFTIDRSGPSSRYWPQNQAITRNDGSWIGQIYGIGGDPGKIRNFGAFLVGPDGQVLVRYCKEANQKRTEPGEKPLPLSRLTRDIIPCHEVDVVLVSGDP